MMKKQEGRPLGTRERLLWLLDQQRPVHFTMAAEITATFTTNQWLRALHAVQQQHPLLSVGIQINSSNAPEFKFEYGRIIPLKIVKTATPDAWVSELEQDTVQRFDSTCAPLMRAAVYESDNQSVIALTAHHAISDGRSLSFVLRDLLNAIDGKIAPAYDMPPSMDSYTEKSRNAANEIAVDKEIINGFKEQPPKAWPKPQIQLLALSEELSSQVIKRSKEEHTSVHGTLSAALVWANKSWKSNPISIYSPVSVRETVGAEETTSVFITGRTVPFDINVSKSFWDTARDAKYALAGANSLDFLSVFNQALLEFISTIHNWSDIANFVNTKLAHDFLLSNLGSLPFSSHYGQFTLKSIWGPFLLPGSENSYSLGVATINGSIRLTLTSLGDTELKPILEGLKDILQEQTAYDLSNGDDSDCLHCK
ncbi:condensation domain-containing protein [Mucilaginibacter endophyticus]|uniref:condensation domain-containing protein n=1 Tax=Mucilaginibacter endophyticus TaxID=2675003 RepID=UPI000E0DE6F6|nr:condensation domain-containing protein [Mucilaginibacter endophyticus]